MGITENQIRCRVRMQPFLDSNVWKVGMITKVEKDWFYVKWEDIGEMQHYHQEANDMILEMDSLNEKKSG